MKKKKVEPQTATQNPYKNLICVVRLFFLCMILSINCLFANEGYTQIAYLDLNMKNAKLEDVFEEIRKQSEFVFFYNNDQIDVKRKVSINVNKAKITDILDRILKGEYSYAIEDKYILIKKKNETAPQTTPILKEEEAASPEKKITGTITDIDGTPLIGVSIQVVGEKAGTISGIDGKYTLSVPDEKAKLRYSYLGHKTMETTVSNRSLINVVLEENPHDIDEIIVIGYGAQKKVNLTGAVNQISGEEFENRPVPRLSQSLQGIVPNLNVTFGGGVPGQDASINIRGTTSINGGGPYVLIDGIPGNINRLSSQEVESITVLKDAAAAAIYGAQGAWGVILVTTKSAKAGKTSISYGNHFGWSTPTVNTDFITTGYDWMRLNDASIAHVGGYSRYPESDMNELYIRRNDKTEHPDRPWVTIQNRDGRDRYVYYGNYDWWDTMFHEWQPSMNHSINFTGGNDKINYMLSGSYNSKDGIMKINRDKYKGYNMRSKISTQVLPWMKIVNNTNFYHQKYDYTGRSGGGNANFSSINVHASPAYAPINPDGTATYFSGFNNYTIGDGLYAILVDGNTKGQNTKYEFRTTTEVIFDLAKGLTATANYSYNLYTDPGFYRQYPATYSLYPGVVEVVPKANVNHLSESQNFNHTHVINAFATYEKSFNRSHNFKVMSGFNQELHLAKKISAGRYDVLSPELNDLNLATGEMSVGGGQSELALRGVFFRINYDYKGKYLFETNGRYDGTSRFPKGDRFGFFPSVSVGWRISEEGFFEPLRNAAIDNLKWRASYGTLGNQATSSRYMYIPSLSGGTMNYILDGEKAKYINQPGTVSKSLTWEKIRSSNLGIDIGLLNNRFEFNFDIYKRETLDMLAQAATLPAVYGATEPKQNVADLETKGFELSVSWRDEFMLAGKRFSYRMGGSLSDYQAKITKMNNSTGFTYDYYEGKKIGEIWGFITNGYFKTEAEALTYPVDQSYLNVVRNDNHIGLSAGDIRFEDLDGDGKITSGTNTVDNPGDQRIIGNSTPRYSFGFNIGADYAGFDLSVFFQGIGKCDWYPGNEADRFWGPFGRPYYSFIPEGFENKLWTPENPNSYFPRLLTYIALNARNELYATNNRYLQDLAYIRLKNVTIGYTVPKSLTQKRKINKCRLYASAENLLTFTKLDTDYIDPEQAIANANARVYPFSKIYSLGINITF
jgi:TonB-linked SusC/RagA family outer membrane protein